MIYDKDIAKLQPGQSVWKLQGSGLVERRTTQAGWTSFKSEERGCYYFHSSDSFPLVRLESTFMHEGELCEADVLFLTEAEAITFALQRVQATLRRLGQIEATLLRQQQVAAGIAFTAPNAGKRKRKRRSGSTADSD